jgi:hypothetical protein
MRELSIHPRPRQPHGVPLRPVRGGRPLLAVAGGMQVVVQARKLPHLRRRSGWSGALRVGLRHQPAGLPGRELYLRPGRRAVSGGRRALLLQRAVRVRGATDALCLSKRYLADRVGPRIGGWRYCPVPTDSGDPSRRTLPSLMICGVASAAGPAATLALARALLAVQLIATMPGDMVPRRHE